MLYRYLHEARPTERIGIRISLSTISTITLGTLFYRTYRTKEPLNQSVAALSGSFTATYAVSMLDAGEDYKTLQENLSHASAAFTLNQYAHVSKKMMLRTSKKMNGYFANLMPKESA